MIVDRFLSDSAKRTPDAIAVIELNRSISYGELDRLANRFANMFASHGVRRGDRIVIAGDNSIDFIAAYFGAMRAGAVSVPLPAGPRNDRFAKALADCQPVACVVDTSLMADPVCGQALTSVRSVFVYPHRGAWRNQAMPQGGIELRTALQAADDTPPAVRLIDLDLAAIIYTSGSTGEPRGVMLTHRNIATNTRSIVQYLQLTAADRVMCVLPFYYVYGLSLLHTHVYAGGSLVIENRFAYPSVVLRGMREHRVTGVRGRAVDVHAADDSPGAHRRRPVVVAVRDARPAARCLRRRSVRGVSVYPTCPSMSCTVRPKHRHDSRISTRQHSNASSARSAAPFRMSTSVSSVRTDVRQRRARRANSLHADQTSRADTGTTRQERKSGSVRSAIAPATSGTSMTRATSFSSAGATT
jgi:acyl-CoA synthetase (AMP-forming)/AMP-acid ligase II